MSPELGFALFLTLLWGPTALWLGLRALRGHQSRRSGPFNVASDTAHSSLPGPGVADALLSQGFWVCGECRSVNRREAKRCYGCETAMEPDSQPTPEAQPVRRMVPVMAEGVAVPSGGAARTTAPAATSWTNPAVFDVLKSDPEPVVTAAPPEVAAAVPVCPFLGFRNDPSTRCDFADPRNSCHATSARGGASLASPRRFIPGKAGSTRSQEIGASHQTSLCLTTAHEQCARYPAVQVVAAN
jgi:hypothetical protein